MFNSNSNTTFESLLNRPSPSRWQQFSKEPCLYLARLIYGSQKLRCVEPPSNPVSLVCISDTHNAHLDLEIPLGEILIHAGDATQSGTAKELQATIDWLDVFPHRHKVMIGGNHDLVLDSQKPGFDSKEKAGMIWRSIIHLENEGVTLQCTGDRQIQLYGSPQTPRHGNWAFQYPRADNVWSETIPAGIDILITHGPPRSHLDIGYGCDYLLEELWRTRPRLHVFGHIHGEYGKEWVHFDEQQKAFEVISKLRGGL